MLRKNIRNTILSILPEKVIINQFHNSLFRSKIIHLRRFIEDVPWWSEYVVNWWDLFFIYLNIKKTSNISCKNGFVFKAINKENWYILIFYFKLPFKHNVILQNRGNKYLAIINDLKIIFENIYDGLQVINEIFIREAYGFYDFNNKIIIDIGGYIGCSALYFISKGAKKVFVYEINERVFNLLKENIKINNFEGKITAFNIGVAKEKINQSLYITDRPSTSRIYKPEHYPGGKIIGEKIVGLTPFKDILKEPIDILKMDCEGSEYDVLENILENNLVDKIRNGIILETHKIDDKRTPTYAISLLKRIGFKKIHTCHNNAMVYTKKF